MKKNVGTIDKVIRILVAVVVVVLYFTNVISGTLGIILLSLVGNICGHKSYKLMPDLAGLVSVPGRKNKIKIPFVQQIILY